MRAFEMPHFGRNNRLANMRAIGVLHVLTDEAPHGTQTGTQTGTPELNPKMKPKQRPNTKLSQRALPSAILRKLEEDT